MEITPDKHNTWKVDTDHLEEALAEIHRYGSTVVSVTPLELELETPHATAYPHQKAKVTSYLIIYYNPPINAIPGIEGDGAPATIQ
jgi:hypothetical protein